MDNLCIVIVTSGPSLLGLAQGEALDLKGEEATQYTPHLSPVGAFLVVVYFSEVGRAIQTKSLKA